MTSDEVRRVVAGGLYKSWDELSDAQRRELSVGFQSLFLSDDKVVQSLWRNFPTPFEIAEEDAAAAVTLINYVIAAAFDHKI